MGSVERMVIQMYRDKLSDAGAIEVKMNLELWNPTQTDIDYVINDMKGLAKSQIEDCGELEWAQETYENIRNIKKAQSINEKRELMQDHLAEMFHAVPVGLIRKYYNSEYADFVEKALGVEYIIMGEPYSRL